MWSELNAEVYTLSGGVNGACKRKNEEVENVSHEEVQIPSPKKAKSDGE
jgi:hypothetical protein